MIARDYLHEFGISTADMSDERVREIAAIIGKLQMDCTAAHLVLDILEGEIPGLDENTLDSTCIAISRGLYHKKFRKAPPKIAEAKPLQ